MEVILQEYFSNLNQIDYMCHEACLRAKQILIIGLVLEKILSLVRIFTVPQMTGNGNKPINYKFH